MRSFVFIERISEVTDVFDRERDFTAVSEAIASPTPASPTSAATPTTAAAGASSATLVEDDLHPRATVIVLGDARTNGPTCAPTSSPRSPPTPGRTFLLNPEPRLYWNYGDSVIAAYEHYCEAFECWTTGQLEDFVKALTRSPLTDAFLAPARLASAWPASAAAVLGSLSCGYVICTSQLTKRYGETLALDSLDLDVSAGEVYGYLGPNAPARRRPSGCSSACIGRPRAARSSSASTPGGIPLAAHRLVASLPEGRAGPRDRRGDFEFLARVRGGTDVAYRDALVERFQLDTAKKVRALSKGNRQKVQLVAAFATRPDLLILDEPTSGLDPLMEVAFRDTVHEADGARPTVFLSSHILSEVEALCDRVGILRDGRLVERARWPSCAT